MSLVAYQNGRLSVDRSGLDIRMYDITKFHPCNVLKMYVSNDNRIVVAYSGNEIDFKSPDWRQQMGIFRRVLSAAKGGTEGIELRCAVLDCYLDLSMMVMTKQACFEFVRFTAEKEVTGSYGYLHAVNPKVYSFLGSGQDIAEFLASTNPKISMDKIFKLTAQYAAGMWETKVDTAYQDELASF